MPGCRALARYTPALLLGVGLWGCEGSTPTEPSPPAAPAEVGVSVRGRLTGFYDAATRFSGTSATLATVPPVVATPAVDGTFEFASVPPGVYKLTFTGPGHIERAVTAEVMAGGANDLGVIDAVERTVGAFQFNLAMADEMLRLPIDVDGRSEVGTARWVTTPTVYVDLPSLEPHQSRVFYPPAGRCPVPVGRLLETIRDAVAVRAPELTGNRLRPMLVEVSSSAEMPAVGTPGTILITGGFVSGHFAGFADQVINQRFEITSAVIVLSTISETGGPGNVDRTTTTHELGHAFGRNHTTMDVSVMGDPPFQGCTPTLHDLRYGEYQYRRPPGTRSPDDTSRVETIRGR